MMSRFLRNFWPNRNKNTKRYLPKTTYSSGLKRAKFGNFYQRVRKGHPILIAFDNQYQYHLIVLYQSMIDVQDIFRSIGKNIMRRMNQTVFQKTDEFIYAEKRDTQFDSIFRQMKQAISQRLDQHQWNFIKFFDNIDGKESGKKLQQHFLQAEERHAQNLENYLQNSRLVFAESKYERNYIPQNLQIQQVSAPEPVQTGKDSDNGSVVRRRQSSQISRKSIQINEGRKKSCQHLRKLSKEFDKSSKEQLQVHEAIQQKMVQVQSHVVEQAKSADRFRPIQEQQYLAQQKQEIKQVQIAQPQQQQHRSQVQQEQELARLEQANIPKQEAPAQSKVLQMNKQAVKQQQQIVKLQQIALEAKQVNQQGENLQKEEVSSENSLQGDNVLAVSEKSKRLDNLYRRSQKMRDKFIKLSPMILSPSEHHHFNSEQLNKSEIITTQWQQQQLSSYQSQPLPIHNSAFTKAKEQSPQKTATSTIRESLDCPLPYNVDKATHYSSQSKGKNKFDE